MNFIYEITRDDTTVKITINSNLGTCKPYYPFAFNCNTQENAELLKNHFEKTFEDFLKYIAKNPAEFIWGEDLSKVKKYLNENWNSRENCWK